MPIIVEPLKPANYQDHQALRKTIEMPAVRQTERAAARAAHMN